MQKNKSWVLAAVMAVLAKRAHAQIKGAGSTFAANLYGNWGLLANNAGGMRLAFDPIGSSGGVNAAQDHNVDFAASDRPPLGCRLGKHEEATSKCQL
jgi:phosphate transport system substrate-binding protein